MPRVACHIHLAEAPKQEVDLEKAQRHMFAVEANCSRPERELAGAANCNQPGRELAAGANCSLPEPEPTAALLPH